jgi:uncharacterized protein YbjQ (UPF0145 family)
MSRSLSLLFLAALLAGCSGPRMKQLSDADYERRPSIYPIEVYTNEVSQPYREIAIIESSAYADDTDDSRVLQLEELKKKARGLGADAVQDVRVLSKRVKGFTTDERTPFPSVRQGEYPTYFMRGTAIIFESSLPGSVAKNRGFRIRVEDGDLEPPPAEETPAPPPEDTQN